MDIRSITPFLWFEDKAEEAVDFYVATFEDSEITGKTRFSDDVPGPPGKVMTISFKLAGQPFTALNGGPVEGDFDTSFTGAISFMVQCGTQADIDHLWDTLSDGGKPNQCGWLTDRYGITWQIVPARLNDLLGDPDPAVAQRVTRAMLKMHKFDIAALERAKEG